MKDTQRDGAVVIVICAIVVYIIVYSFSFFKTQIHNFPYGNKASGSVIVAVRGDTEFNGIYYLPEEATVSDLLMASGMKYLEQYDTKILNTRILTGNAVNIEAGNRLTIGEMNNAKKVALDIPIDINKATQDDLILITGIGEKTALKIIQHRTQIGRFNKLEELM
ncbi:MAG: helix-hairpin-helix domain-containing protein, partial [Syntrophaceae bacterium]